MAQIVGSVDSRVNDLNTPMVAPQEDRAPLVDPAAGVATAFGLALLAGYVFSPIYVRGHEAPGPAVRKSIKSSSSIPPILPKTYKVPAK